MSKLLTLLRTEIIKHVKSNSHLKRDILKFVVSECDLLANSQNQAGKQVSDEQVYKVIKKVLADNLSTLEHIPNCADSRHLKLVGESNYLSQFLPQTLSQNEILDHVTRLDIFSCKSDGQAVGLCMKYFKEHKVFVEGGDVLDVISQLRRKVCTK